MDDIQRQMLKLFCSAEVQEFYKAVGSEIGYQLDTIDGQAFLYFHSFLTNPQPEFVSKWRSDPQKKNWYQQLTNGILTNVQNCLACVLYHADNLKRLESRVLEKVETIGYRKVIGSSTVACGNTLILDFEYQAFVLAYRRCLDYLTRSIAAYFKQEFHSFRKIENFLQRFDTTSKVPAQVVPIVGEFYEKFEFVLSDGADKSVRDKVSHYEFVPAGTFNLSQRGLYLVGGGEELKGWDQTSLSEVIEVRTFALKLFLRKSITNFTKGMQMDEPDS